MKEKLNNNIYKSRNVKNFRELLISSVKKYGKKVAYKYKINFGKEDEKVVSKTYNDVYSDISSLGAKLLDMGLENEKIAVISNNRYEWCMTYFAVTTSNMVIVPLDKALPEQEILSLIKRSKVKAVVYDKKYSDIFERIKEEETTLKYYINMDEPEKEFELGINYLIKQGEGIKIQGKSIYDKVSINEKKMSVLIFTSGTTAMSKGVMLSQENICSNVVGMSKMSKMYTRDVLLSFLPLHHTFECTITFLYGFYSGATVAFADGLRYIAKNLKEYKVTDFVAVPLILETIYKKLEKGIKDSGKDEIVKKLTKICNRLLKYKIDIRRIVFRNILKELGGKIRIAYFGAASMNKDIIEGYNNFGISTVQGYGLTETSPLVSAETDKNHRPGSVGICPYNEKVKILDEDDNGVGEVTVKGKNIMLGYYENLEATKDAFTEDGWFKTGDLGYIDEDGYLYITGRKKDVIVLKNGENIYPNDIEHLINQLPYVAESIVFPRLNAKDEINLGIKVVLDEKETDKKFKGKTESELKELIWQEVKKINEKLSQFKRIKELIVSREPLEKTTTHKIKRFIEIDKILKSKKEDNE